MRAISSRRWSAASALTRVATRLPLSSASLEISRCWPARAATCGACVTAITCTLAASRASRAPMASATAPPTPVSISSNTSVGAEPRSASTTFSASRKRDSSPPEATFISGPGRVPGLVCTQNSTRSNPCGPGEAAIALDLGGEGRALELQRRELGIDGLVELSRGFLARGRELLRRGRIALCRPPRRRLPASSAARRRHRSARHRRHIARRARRARRPAWNICARRRAARTAAPRSARARPDRNRRRGSAAVRCWSASSSALIAMSIAFTAGSTSAANWRRGAPAGAPRPTAPRPANDRRATASCASRRSAAIFSPCIITVRRSASAVSSPSCGASVFNSSEAWRR